MKYLGLLICTILIIGLPILARADTYALSSPIVDSINDNLKNFPATEGVIYCVREHQWKNLASITVAKYQNPKYDWAKLDFDIGYAASSATMLEIMYPIDLAKLHITVPIVKEITISVGYGYGWVWADESRKRDGGPAITGSYKF
jgi:hypothetical protein